MKKYITWLRNVLLAISALIVCWFALQVGKKAWSFFRLDTKVQATILKWEVQALPAYSYGLHATFQYTVDGKEIIARTLFSRSYPNRYAAESDIKSHAKTCQAWYQKKNPAFSSLEKKFPKKECIHLLLTAGVFLYFYCARTFLLHFASEETQ